MPQRKRSHCTDHENPNKENTMRDTVTSILSHPSVNIMDAIHQRRSVRNYTRQAIDTASIDTLLKAAVLAPTAMYQEPWSFVVIQDKDVLDRLAESCVEQVRDAARHGDTATVQHKPHVAYAPEFHASHGAGTLIILCGKFTGPFVEADCWLAAENLMLAACAMGLGTCVIGLAIELKNG